MYDGATASLTLAGTTLTISAAVWWPMAIFAMVAMVIALGRIFLQQGELLP